MIMLRRSLALLLSAVLLFFAVGPSYADGSGSTVVLQVIGRNQILGMTTPGNGTVVSFGYLTAIRGIKQPLFSNPATISEATAYFTFRSERQPFTTLANGNSQVRIRTPGSLIRIYYNPNPGGNFDNPESFSAGEVVAVLRHGFSQAIRVDNMATSVDSMEFVSAQPFTFGGRQVDLRRLLKGGLTLYSTGPAVTVATSGVGATHFAFGASAVRTGNDRN